MSEITKTYEFEEHEVRKLIAAVGVQIDRHHTEGHDDTAKEYRELNQKLSRDE